MTDTAFNFAPQTQIVSALIEAAALALPMLPEIERIALSKALAPFQEFSVATVWSVIDVHSVKPGISDAEAKEVMRIFVDEYRAGDSEWSQLKAI